MIRIVLLQIRVTLGQFLIIIRTEDQPESPAFFFQMIRVQVEAYLRAGRIATLAIDWIQLLTQIYTFA